MTDIQAWGWDWVKRAHLDQLELKTGLKGERELLELMASAANSPDERIARGRFEDRVLSARGARLLLRTLDGDAMSFFPVAGVEVEGLRTRWKLRWLARVFGPGGLAHSALGGFSSKAAPRVEAFLPHFPALEGGLELLRDYDAAIELIPFRMVSLGPARELPLKRIAPLEGEERGWHVSASGVVSELRPSCVVLDCGCPVFVEKGAPRNLSEGEAVRAEGALYAYPSL